MVIDNLGDRSGHALFKNTIPKAVPKYGSVLLLSGAGGPMPPTREYVGVARQVGDLAATVVLNNVDAVDDQSWSAWRLASR